MWKMLKDWMTHQRQKAIAASEERDQVALHKEQPFTPRPSWRRMENGCYLIRTQAGFMQALRHCCPDRTRKELRDAINSWPKVYPSVVRIRIVGYSHIDVTVASLGDYRAKTQALLDDLAGE